MMNLRLTPLLSHWGIVLWTLLGCGFMSLSAESLVYRLDFKKVGESINFRPYAYAYYVVPIEGGAGTLLLTQVTGAQRRYYRYEAVGEMFIATKGKQRKMVLHVTNSNGENGLSFYCIGEVNRQEEYRTRNFTGKVGVAERLKGLSIQADSEDDLVIYGGTEIYGMAGASEVEARLDKVYTQRSAVLALDVSATVDAIQNQLRSENYVDGLGNNNGNGGGNAPSRNSDNP